MFMYVDFKFFLLIQDIHSLERMTGMHDFNCGLTSVPSSKFCIYIGILYLYIHAEHQLVTKSNQKGARKR